MFISIIPILAGLDAANVGHLHNSGCDITTIYSSLAFFGSFCRADLENNKENEWHCIFSPMGGINSPPCIGPCISAHSSPSSCIAGIALLSESCPD